MTRLEGEQLGGGRGVCGGGFMYSIKRTEQMCRALCEEGAKM